MTVVECPDMKVMLDRKTGGFHVEVGTIPTTGEWILQGTTETYRARVPILPEQRMKAYLHPCIFLPHPDRFFRDLKEGELADESSLPPRGTGMHNVEDDLNAVEDDFRDYCAGCNQTLLAHETGLYCSNCGDYAAS